MKKVFLIFSLVFCALYAGAHTTVLLSNPDVSSLDKGKELYRNHQIETAYQYFENFLKQSQTADIDRQEASYYKAICAFSMKKADAEQLLLNFRRNYPVSDYKDQVLYRIALLSYEKSDFEGYLRQLADVNVQNLSVDENAEMLMHKAYALMNTGKVKESREIFKSQTENKFNQVEASYYYAYSSFLLGDDKTALPIFLTLENTSAYGEKIPYFILQIYYHQGQNDNVLKKSAEILRKFPTNKNNAEVYRILGELAFEDKSFEKATENLGKYEKMSMKLMPRDMYMLGMSWYELGDFGKAIEYLQKSTAVEDAISENAYLYLGNAYLKTKDLKNAKMSFDAALRTRFNDEVREQALYNYALTCYETDAVFGETVTALEQFLQEYPDSQYADEAQKYLASAFMSSSDYAKSLEVIAKISRPNKTLQETRQFVLYQLGTESFSKNETDNAIDYFTKSIQVPVKGKYRTESYFWKAECNYRLGKNDLCASDLQSYFQQEDSKLSVNYAQALYSLGYAYFASKKYADALDWFRKFIDNAKSENEVLSDAYNRAGDCNFFLRNLPLAEKSYLSAAEKNPLTGDYATFQSAYVAGLMKNYSAKISRLKSLVSEYPNSEYVDDALYEIGRSFIMLNNENEAIKIYQQLLSEQPNSALARKAAVEIGMIYDNQDKPRLAIDAFQQVIANYPGTEEAYTALESLENIYIALNDVKTFLAYSKTLNRMGNKVENRQDSISYIASEKQYMNGNYQSAVDGFKEYVNAYCPGGRYCSSAIYYMADSYLKLDDKESALIEYGQLLKIQGNPYREEAALKCASISFDLKQFADASDYFKELLNLSQSFENKQIARLGLLRSAYQLNDYEDVILAARLIVEDGKSDADTEQEARYLKAKALLKLERNTEAITELKVLSENTRTQLGAESKYLLAQAYFDSGSLTSAENEVIDFAKKRSPFAYWLARSFVLLSDVYVKQGNDFQAKQYLLSLKKNYKEKDDVQVMLAERLTAIAQRENNRTVK